MYSSKVINVSIMFANTCLVFEVDMHVHMSVHVFYDYVIMLDVIFRFNLG
jgi:hypothetical protein